MSPQDAPRSRSQSLHNVTVRRRGDPVSAVTLELPAEESPDVPLEALVASHRLILLASVPEAVRGVPVTVRRGDAEVRLEAPAPQEAAAGEQSRAVMTRLAPSTVAQLDLLVDAGICRSRSEAVAWCVRRTLAREGPRISALQAPVAALWDARAALLRPDGLLLGAEARRILDQAESEARARQYRYAGTEHLLLAILAVADTEAQAVLRALGASPDRLAAALDHTLGQGDSPSPKEVQFTPRATTLVEDLAPAEARALADEEVAAVHLLLALAADAQTAAARALAAEGADGPRIRAEVARRRAEGSGGGR